MTKNKILVPDEVKLQGDKGQLISKENPLPIKDIDDSQRTSLNTVFGEKQIGIRKADIAAQFQYGVPQGASQSGTENGGSIATVESLLTLSTGTNIAGSAYIANKKALRYLPGHEAYIVFTAVFTEGKDDSYQRAGIFDDNNGFFVGYEGSQFTITRRRAGVDHNQSVDIEEIYEDGTFNPAYGNVYRISFGYLGFATINFEVLNPDGGWISYAKIKYPNTSTVTHITNTNLQPRLEVANTGNDTDIVTKTGSFSAGVINGGGADPAVRKYSVDLADQSITAGEDMAITLRNKSTFNGLTNYIMDMLSLISVATDLSKNSIWEFRKNMTITNTPTWTDIFTDNSNMEYSTDAVVTSDTGRLGFAFTMGKVDRLFEFVDKLESEIYPEETITIIIKTPGGTNGTYDLALRWKELF